MTVAYFPGCSAVSTGRELAESTEALMEALGLALVEIPDWNCCGATSAGVVSPRLSIELNARNLKQAALLGVDMMLVPCAACYNRLKTTQLDLKEKPALAKELDVPATALKMRIVNLPEILLENLELIKSMVKVDLSHLRPGAYYGCLLLRPPKTVQFDDPEQPTSMERILEAIGLDPAKWNMRTECCGASLASTRPGIVEKRVEKIVASARAGEADCLIAACPLCVLNLESRQSGSDCLPAFYLSELVGAAIGLEPAKLGTSRHLLAKTLVGAKGH
jgi:heterodisulfide reductase subunit B2